MTQHIGIVACSAEGAALCYRTVALEGAKSLGPHDHPEVSMHTHPLARYMELHLRQRLAGVADLMLSSAEKLAGMGADFLICPDNTIHQAFPLFKTALRDRGYILQKRSGMKLAEVISGGWACWARDI